MIVVVLVFLRPALQPIGEIARRVAGDLAAVQVEALAEPEVDVPLNHRQVDAADGADVLGEAASFISSQVRSMMRPRPVSPTNM